MNSESQVQNENANEWIPLSEAAKFTPYSADYLSLLARKRRLTAKKIDGIWYTTRAILTNYLAQQVKRAEVLNQNSENYLPFIESSESNQGEGSIAPMGDQEVGKDSALSPRLLPTVTPRLVSLPEENVAPQISDSGDKLMEEFMRRFNAQIDRQVDAQHGWLFKLLRFVRRSFRYTLWSAKFPLFVISLVIIVVLPLRFVSGFADNFFQGTIDAVKNAQTVMGFRPGTHENEILLLGPKGEIAIFGNVETEGQFRSYVEDGIAPITVKSTTKVDNLNADMLDGTSAHEFTLAYVTKNGNITYEPVFLEGAVEVGQTLMVKGATKLLDSLRVDGNLSVFGAANFAKGITVSGPAVFKNLITAPTLIVSDLLRAHRLVVEDDLTVEGAISATSGRIKGNFYVEDTFRADANVSLGSDGHTVRITSEEWSVDNDGNAFFEDLTARGDTTLQALSVGGSANFSGPISIAGALNDASGSAGTLGYILQSTGTSTQWVATSSLGIVGGGGSGITSLNGQTGVTQSFATGTATGIGLTITSSGDVHTFTPTVSAGYSIPLTASTTEWSLAYASTTALTPSYMRGLFSNTATGLTYDSATGITSLTSGYTIPLTASTTEWSDFYNTPSTRITAGDNLAWSGNTLVGTFGTSSARASISETVTGLDYDSATGILSSTSGYVIPLTASTTEWSLAYASSTSLTPSYIRGLFSNTATGLTYNSTTGATSLTSGYIIPLSASTTEWTNFYNAPSTRITAGNGLAWTGNSIGIDGPVSVANGGTGATSLTGVLLGNGTSAFTATTSLSSSYIEDAYVRNTGDTMTGNLVMGGTTANIALGSNWLSGDGDDEGIFVGALGHVGIGTSSPAFRLDIVQSSNDYGIRTSDGTTEAVVGISSTNTGLFGTRSNNDTQFITNNTIRATIASNGNFGIGDTSPASLLSVGAGDAFQVSATGTVTSGTWNGNDIDISDFTNLSVGNGITLTDDVLTVTAAGGLAQTIGGLTTTGVLEDLNTLGAPSADGEFIVATGAGTFAYESGATARTSLGLGTIATQNANNVAITGGTAELSAATTTDLVVTGGITTSLSDGCVEVAGGVLTSLGASCGTGSGGLTSLNGLTASSQSFATSTSGGIRLNITSSGGVHTFTAGLTSGYTIPLTASTTEWTNFYNTPSTRITAGDNLAWSGNTLVGTFGTSSARASISETVTGIDYSSSTGVLSLTSGYVIPLSASTTEWSDFYNTPSTRITAGDGVSWTSNTLNLDINELTEESGFTSGDYLAFYDATAGAIRKVNFDNLPGAGGGLTSLNGLSVASQTFATSSSGGLTLNINSSGSVHTFTPGVASGYTVPLTASTTQWSDFYNTPSTRITAGDGLSWSANTLNLDINELTTEGTFETGDYLAFYDATAGAVRKVAYSNLPGAGGSLTSLNGLTSASQTFATSSDTNIGINIVSSGSTHTFTPTWTGTLAVARGGTGAATLTGLVVGNGTSAMTATTTSAGLASVVGDETGSGALVFGTSPTFTTNATFFGDTISDFTGVGLTLSSGALTVATSTLGLDTNFFQQNGNSFGTTATLGTNDSNNLAFETNNSTRMMIASTTGNVGIGTIGPVSRLHVVETTLNTPAALIEGVITNSPASGYGSLRVHSATSSTSSYSSIIFTSYDTTDVNRHGAGISMTKTSAWTGGSGSYPGDLSFWTRPPSSNEVERLRITSDGNVGIGTTTPGSLLTVAGTAEVTGAATLRSTLNVTGNTTLTNASTTNFSASGTANITGATALGSTLNVTGNTTLANASTTNLTVSTNSYLGTVRSGTWNGSTIGETYGGTGQTTYATGDMLYASGANTLAKRTIGSAGQVLMVSGGVPTWTATSSLGFSASFFQQNGNSFGTTATLGTNDANTLAFETSGTARMTILSSGNVGIGDDTPASLFTVGAGDAFQVNSSGVVLAGSWNGSDIDISDYTNLSVSNGITLTGDVLSVTAAGGLAQTTGGLTTTGVLEDLNTLGAPSADGEFIVATGAGTFAYESGATVRTSLGLVAGGAGDIWVEKAGDTMTGNLVMGGTAANIALGSNYLSGDGDDEGVYVSSTGNVGIGTSSPDSTRFLTVERSSGTNTGVAKFISTLTNAASDVLIIDADNSASRAALQIQGNGGNTEVAFFGSNGNVGIGTTTPSARLHVLSTTEQLRLAYDGSNYWTDTVASNGDRTIAGNGTGGSLNIDLYGGATGDFSVNSDDFYVDTSSGNVGVGTTTPIWNFAVESSSGATTMGIQRTSGRFANLYAGTVYSGINFSSAGYFAIGPSASQSGTTNTSLIIAGGGNVGIGTTTPGSLLTVAGTAEVTGAAALRSTLNVTGNTTLTNASSTNLTVSGNLYNSSLTSGRVPYVTTGGQLTDSSTFTYDGTMLSSTADASISLRGGRSTAQNISLYGSAGGNILYSLSATNNAKSLTINATTDTSNTAPSAGTNGINFQIRGANALTIDDSRNIGLPDRTASRLLATDASKNLVSTITLANVVSSISDVTGSTGTGNLVLSASPTFTGTVSAAALTLSGMLTQSSSGIRVATADDLTTRLESGFFQTATATTGEGWPETTNNWYHLITNTHSNTGNYYSLQIAGSFFDQSLYFRKTNNSGATSWSKIVAVTDIDTSAEMASILTDETGTGNLVLSAGPTFTGNTTLANASTTNLTVSGNTYLSGISSSGTINFSGLTASRLVATDASKNLVSTITLANVVSSISDVSGSTGTTNLVLSASPTLTGTTTAAIINASGNIITAGEFISTTANQARFIAGNYGLIHRNDGSNYYMLLTASGDQYGTWNSLRPFNINNSTGNVSLGNSALYVEHSGNVGIGTTTPGQKLHVLGKAVIGNTTSSVSGGRVLQIYTGNVSNANAGIDITRGPTATYGTATSQLSLRLASDGSGVYRAAIGYSTSDTPGEQITINSSGNVGIGTTTPSQALTVIGSVDASVQFLGQGADTVSAPSFSWTGDTNVGMYRPATDTIGLVTNGAERLRVDSSGNVAIGTTTPATLLHLYKSSAAVLAVQDNSSAIRILNTSGVNYIQSGTSLSTSAADLRISSMNAGSSPWMTFQGSTGNIGIGTTTPAAKLNVLSTTEQLRLAYSSSVYWTDTIASDGGRTMTGFGTDADLNIVFTGATDGDFSINDDDFFVDTSSGNVGVGTTTPIWNFAVESSSGATTMGIQRTSGRFANLYAGTVYSGINFSSAGYFAIGPSASQSGTTNTSLVVAGGGNVGIGSSTPENRLTVVSGAADIATLYRNSSANAALEFRNTIGSIRIGAVADTADFAIAPTNALTSAYLTVKNGTGNVGIGTTTPTSKLSISGSATNGDSLLLMSGDGSNGTDSTQVRLGYSGAATYQHSIRTRHNASAAANNAIDFWLWDQTADSVTTLGSKRVMTIEGTGNVGIGTTTPSQALTVVGSIDASVQFLGQASDTVSAPSFSWTGDTNVGMYRPATDTIGLVTNGAERLRVDSSGNVAIGTTNTSFGQLTLTDNINIRRNTDGWLLRHTRTDDTQVVGIYASGHSGAVGLDFYTANTERMKITSGGVVNIAGLTASRLVATDASKNLVSTITLANVVSSISDVTGSTGTGNLVLSAGPTLTGNTTLANASTTNLTVAGSTYLTGPIIQDHSNATYDVWIQGGTAASGDGRNLALLGNASTDDLILNYNSEYDCVSVGGTSCTEMLTVTGSVDASVQFLGQGADTVSAPSFSWTGDTNVGMYRPATDTIGLVTNGAERLRITSTGLVGIGTTTPDNRLTVDGNFSQMGAGTNYFGRYTTGSVAIEVGSGRTVDNYAYIDLVGDTTYTDYGFRIIRGNSGANTTTQLTHRGTGDFSIHAQEAANIVFYTTSAARMTIHSSGTIGIGTSSPSSVLHVANATPVITLQDSNGATTAATPYLEYKDSAGTRLGYVGYGSGSTSILGIVNSQSADIGFYTADTQRMTITSGGNVGIGTSSPENISGWTKVLDVYGAGNSKSIVTTSVIRGGMYAHNSGFFSAPAGMIMGANSNHPLSFITNGASRMTINTSGNVGIGTTTPSQVLTVIGSVDASVQFLGQASDTVSAPSFSWTGDTDTGMYRPSADVIGFTFGGTQALQMRYWDSTSNADLAALHNGVTDAGILLQAAANANFTIGLRENGTDDAFEIVSGGGNWNSDSTYDTAILTARANGNVGIGNAIPTYMLHVGSTSVADATVLFRIQDSNSSCFYDANTGSGSCVSDMTLKKDIENINGSLDIITALRPVYYRWKSDSESDPLMSGFLAQEVEAVLPHLVSEHIWQDGSVKKILNTGAMMPYVVGAVIDMNTSLEELLVTGSTTASSTFAFLNDPAKETIWSRMVKLAESFKDGVLELTSAKIEYVKADKIETKELCVGSICVDEGTFLKMVQMSGGAAYALEQDPPTSGGGGGDDDNTNASSTDPVSEPDEPAAGTETPDENSGTETSGGGEEPAAEPTSEPAPTEPTV